MSILLFVIAIILFIFALKYKQLNKIHKETDFLVLALVCVAFGFLTLLLSIVIKITILALPL